MLVFAAIVAISVGCSDGDGDVSHDWSNPIDPPDSFEMEKADDCLDQDVAHWGRFEAATLEVDDKFDHAGAWVVPRCVRSDTGFGGSRHYCAEETEDTESELYRFACFGRPHPDSGTPEEARTPDEHAAEWDDRIRCLWGLFAWKGDDGCYYQWSCVPEERWDEVMIGWFRNKEWQDAEEEQCAAVMPE